MKETTQVFDALKNILLYSVMTGYTLQQLDEFTHDD